MSGFKHLAEKVSQSYLVFPILIVSLIGILIGLAASYEDYMSSFNGYAMLPTRKSSEEIIWLIAALPQIGQILFFYAFVRSMEIQQGRRPKANFLYLLIAGSLFLFDTATDVYFKASGIGGAGVWLLALIESIAIFTIGSEILLTTALGIFLELLAPALEQLSRLFNGLLGEGDSDTAQRPERRMQ